MATLTKVGVGKFAVSSSSICEEDYDKVIKEIKGLVVLAPERVVPVMWEILKFVARQVFGEG